MMRKSIRSSLVNLSKSSLFAWNGTARRYVMLDRLIGVHLFVRIYYFPRSSTSDYPLLPSVHRHGFDVYYEGDDLHDYYIFYQFC